MANMGIWANYLRPPKSVAEYDAEAMTAKTNALGLQEQEGKLNLFKQSQADDAAVRSAYQSAGGDQAKVIDSLTRGGQYKAVEAFKKAQLAEEKARADIAHVGAQTKQSAATAGKTEQETKFAAAAQHAQALAGVNTPQDIMDYIDAGIQSGVFPAEKRELMLQKANQAPSVQAWVANQKQQAIPVLEKFKADAEMSRAQLSAETQIRGQDIGATTARRGQDMTAGTAAAGRAQADRHFGVTSSLASDRLAFDKTKGEDKPLNDSQSKALLFGSRMAEANTVLDSLAKSGTTTSVPGSTSGFGIGPVVTAMSSSKKQQLDQAKRNFLNAVLRRESGAVIADSEFSNGDKQYFPQIGDKPDTIAQKARNRQMAIDGILAEVPQGKRESLRAMPQMPTADDLRKQADNILRGG